MSSKISVFHVLLVTLYLYGIYYDTYNKPPPGSRAELHRNSIGGRYKYLTHLDLVRISIIEMDNILLMYLLIIETVDQYDYHYYVSRRLISLLDYKSFFRIEHLFNKM